MAEALLDKGFPARSYEIVYDDSEDSFGLTSDEETDITSTHFKSRNYARIPFNLKKGDYYAVDAYEHVKSKDQYYIGSITKVKKQSVEMRFLYKTRKVPNQYDWPVKEDTLSNIDPKGLFVGPLQLKGTCPYIIMGLDEAFLSYWSHISN